MAQGSKKNEKAREEAKLIFEQLPKKLSPERLQVISKAKKMLEHERQLDEKILHRRITI